MLLPSLESQTTCRREGIAINQLFKLMHAQSAMPTHSHCHDIVLRMCGIVVQLHCSSRVIVIDTDIFHLLRILVESDCPGTSTWCILFHFDYSGRYVTEGTFRASHRKLSSNGEEDRCFALPPGIPQHTFHAADSQLLQPKESVLCQFVLLPTSYTYSAVSSTSAFAPKKFTIIIQDYNVIQIKVFLLMKKAMWLIAKICTAGNANYCHCVLQGHCIRLAFSGSDTKHCFNDYACDGSRKFWLHSSLDRPSYIRLPGLMPQK